VSQSVRLSRIGWRTRGGACQVWVRGLLVASRTHRKERDVGATPDWEEGFRLCRLSGTKPECALESTASQSARLSRIGWRTRGGASHVWVRRLLVASRTHRKKRDVCATPDWEDGFRLCRLSGTKPECALESTASQSARLSRIG